MVMNKWKWKRLLGLVSVVAIAAALALPGTAFAAGSANITVTGTPLFLSITNTPNTWTLNGITGSGTIAVDTVYYANPLGDTTPPSATVDAGECQFNTSVTAGATTCDLTVTMGAFTGGNATMTNSDSDGSNGESTYGAFCWYDGMTYSSKVVVKSTGSDEMYSSGLAAEASLNWGAEIETRTGAWEGGGASTATLTITATEH